MVSGGKYRSFVHWSLLIEKRAMSLVEEKATAVTRRSAGIPDLIVGTLCALPSTTFFDTAIQKVFMVARREPKPSEISETNLPQVHALNILKSVFTTTKLSATSEAYMVTGLEVAAASLQSPA